MSQRPSTNGSLTWRPPRRRLRLWQRGLSVKQRLVTIPTAAVFARLVAFLWRRDEAVVHLAFAHRALALFPRQPEHRYVPRVYAASFAKLRSPLDDPEFMREADEVLGHRRTKLYYDRLHVLYQALHEVVRAFPSEELKILEGGAFRGGTSFFLSRVASRIAPERTALWAVDTFVGHTEQDMDGPSEGGQATAAHKGIPFDASADGVSDYLSEFLRVVVIEGRIQEVADRLPVKPIHLMHLDMNVYKPTLYGLELAQERLAPGG